jgi:hypothetical protein
MSNYQKLPEYFYFEGVLFKIADDKIIVQNEKDFDVPPTTIGLLTTDEVANRVNYLQGRILTVIDASISDKDQKKAIKDLIKGIMYEEHARLSDSATGFQTLTDGDMVQMSGSVEKFYEENGEPVK